ncbi:7211_t:CDS:2, partial [Racocetra fulgida]
TSEAPQGYKKPYISNNLKDVLLLPEAQSSLTQIEDAIRELKELERSNSIRIENTIRERIDDAIKELKKSERENYT